MLSFLQSVLPSPKILSKHTGSRNIHHIALAPAALGPEDKQKSIQSSSNDEVLVCTFIISLIILIFCWRFFLFQLFQTHTALSVKIADAISREKRFLAEDLAGFESVNGEPMASLMMEKGGQPVRALVTTTWRSGSTFLGDIMTAHPGTFYHYEPLLHYDIVQARSGALARDAVRTLRDLMHCNYTNLGKFGTFSWKYFIIIFRPLPYIWPISSVALCPQPTAMDTLPGRREAAVQEILLLEARIS